MTPLLGTTSQALAAVALILVASVVLVWALWRLTRAARRAMTPAPRPTPPTCSPDPWEESARRAQTPPRTN